MHESAGKRHPVAAPHGNKWLTAMLVEVAGSVGRMEGENHLPAQFGQLTSRRGTSRAAVAVAHSMLVSAYVTLLRDEPCREFGADSLTRRNTEAHTRRLVAELEELGHTVFLDPVGWISCRRTGGTGSACPALTLACSSLIHGCVSSLILWLSGTDRPGVGCSA